MPVRLLRSSLRTSERWHRASYFDRCLYISLLNLVDDFGRYDANASLLASECFPYGDPEGLPVTRQAVDSSLRALASKDMLLVYEKDGKLFLQLTRWRERVRQSSSHFPDPSGCVVLYGCQAVDGQLTGKCLLPTPSPSPSPVPTPTPSPSAVTQCNAPVTLGNACNAMQRQREKQIEEVHTHTEPECVSVPESVSQPPETPQAGNSIIRQKAEYQLKARMEWLEAELNRMYRRPAGYRWSYEEQHLATEIARRPDLKAELQAIQRWRSNIPPAKARFFPQSLASLLRSWDETLDKARCNVSMRDNPHEGMSIAEQNLKRLLAEDKAEEEREREQARAKL